MFALVVFSNSLFQSSTASPEVRIRKLQQFEKLEALADSKIEGKVSLEGCTLFFPLESLLYVTAREQTVHGPFFISGSNICFLFGRVF